MPPTSRVLLAAAALAVVAPAAIAAPSITNPFVFTDNRGPVPGNALPGFPADGGYFFLGASVSPAGPGTTAQAIPTVPGPALPLDFTPSGANPTAYGHFVPYAGQSGQWTISATNGSGTSTAPTHVLDDIRTIPLLTGLHASGPALTPHLTWNAVDPALFPSTCGPCTLGTDLFTYSIEVRLLAGSGLPLFNSAPLSTSGSASFDVPSGLLSMGQSYLIGFKLNHVEVEGFFTDPVNGGLRLISPLENRSNAFLVYQPVPEPSTVLMLAAGLLLLVGVAQRRIGAPVPV